MVSTHIHILTHMKIFIIFIIRTSIMALDPELVSVSPQSSKTWEEEVKREVCWKSHLPPTLSGHCDRGQEWKHACVKAATYLLICWRGFHPSTLSKGMDFVILFCFPAPWKCNILLHLRTELHLLFSASTGFILVQSFPFILHNVSLYIYLLQPLPCRCPHCCVKEFLKKPSD